MTDELSHKKFAILATDGFEQSELDGPRKFLDKIGARVVIVSLEKGKIYGMEHEEKGHSVRVDAKLEDVKARDFDGLVLPGGLINPDTLRSNEDAVAFVREFVEMDKPIAAICHAPWILIETGMVKGRRLTSWPAIRTDVTNAGGEWVDDEVVVDGKLVTSRKPDDIPAFCREMKRVFR